MGGKFWNICNDGDQDNFNPQWLQDEIFEKKTLYFFKKPYTNVAI